MIYIFILLLTIFLFIYFENIEFFEVLPANSSKIKKEETMYDTETDSLIKLFGQNEKQISVKTFEKIPYYESFELSELAKEKALESINEIFNKSIEFKNSKNLIIKDPYNIYYKNILNNRHYIFMIDINNITKKFIRSFIIHLVLHDYNNYFINGSYFFNPNITKDLEIRNINIQLEETESKISGIESLNIPEMSYYKIDNPLHIMDPNKKGFVYDDSK